MTPAPTTRHVGSVEALLSLTLGVLMVVAALVPRTFRQAFLLALGGGLAYRGLMGNGGIYRPAGTDAAHGQAVDEVKAAPGPKD